MGDAVQFDSFAFVFLGHKSAFAVVAELEASSSLSPVEVVSLSVVLVASALLADVLILRAIVSLLSGRVFRL